MIGTRIAFFDQIDSTNNYIKKHIDEFHDGDILVAQTQTSGRGRRDHKWASPRGNVYASFYLDDAGFECAFDVVMLFSNALVNTLQSYNIQAQIKYPNDVLVEGVKISGILIEHINDAYIVGVGINVIPIDSFHPLFHSTSIYQETQVKVDYRDVLQAFIYHLNECLEHKDNWYKEYISHSIVIGKHINHKDEKCLITDIKKTGELILTSGSKQYELPVNEISLEELYDN